MTAGFVGTVMRRHLALSSTRWMSRRVFHPATRSFCASHGSTPPPTSTAEIRSIASQQKLYMIDPSTPGSIFFMPHGARLFNRLVEFMKLQQRMFGFDEVITPVIYRKDLWRQSGHWQHYKRDMFEVFGADHSDSSDSVEVTQDKGEYSLKPMNCPGHCLMFARHERSFRDLPIRYSDFSPLHRNESSGALSGLTRVRKFHQDDGHIFCMPSQVQSEIQSCLKLVDVVYSIFGLSDYELTLSTRPDTYIGTLDVWDEAEAGLKHALNASGKPWTVNEADGAFYGPKIDILVKDNLGKSHQTATIQLDFQLPQNFDLKFTPAYPSDPTTPVMVHRAIFGSIERFMAILIDHYEGKWPFWLNPRQAVVIPVADRHKQYAQSVAQQLSGKLFSVPDAVEATPLGSTFFDVDVALQDEPVSARIKRSIGEGYSYLLIVGDREVDSSTVSLRPRASRATESLTVDEVREQFSELRRSYS